MPASKTTQTPDFASMTDEQLRDFLSNAQAEQKARQERETDAATLDAAKALLDVVEAALTASAKLTDEQAEQWGAIKSTLRKATGDKLVEALTAKGGTATAKELMEEYGWSAGSLGQAGNRVAPPSWSKDKRGDGRVKWTPREAPVSERTYTLAD